MKIAIISVMLGLALLFSINVVFDDAFATWRDSRNTVKISQVNEYANYVHFQP